MKKFNRRDFLKSMSGAFLIAPVLQAAPVSGALPAPNVEPLRLDAAKPPPAVLKNFLKTGTTKNLRGTQLTADSRSLLLDGRRWLPVMGEFHYARTPPTEWRDEILKMKAGGIDIVSSYVFWIHHEESEGVFDWSGQRNLRRFVETCRELGMPFALRVGPWCHGEARNGGFPDWLLKKGWKLRSNDPNYLAKVRLLYGEIAAQVKNLFWKEGGNIISVQLENEYRGSAEHFLSLKKIAVEAGLDAPIYTRTGWTNTSTPLPPGEIVPLYGVYAEGFWDREITPMPGKYREGFLFQSARTDASIATDQLGTGKRKDGEDVDSYPYFCCEIGGGMMTSYHRRILIYPKDIEATSLVKLGAGNNLHGYYMYHGGTNPDGRLSTLHESQATGYWNDVPVKSYDFQAPLGEFGQINPHYHSLRRLHLFLRDFGETLAEMTAYLPEKHATDADDLQTLRWAARTDGVGGFVFINNYQRLQPLAPKTGVQFALKLSGETLTLPDKPFTVPENQVFFLPFNLKINDVTLVYATAQPICRLETDGETYLFFGKIDGVEPEFAFDANARDALEKTNGTVANASSRMLIRNLKTGTEPAARLRTAGKYLNLVLLDERQSLAIWKENIKNREHVFLTAAGLTIDGAHLRLFSENADDLSVSIFPAAPELFTNDTKRKFSRDGIFRILTATAIAPAKLKATFEQIRAAEAPRQIKNGSKGVAEAPSDADFEKAAAWRIKLPKNLPRRKNLLLRIGYQGDAARVSLGGKMLTDNFYNGNVFEIGLNRYAPDIYRQEILLKILPLRQDAPIYLQQDARPDFAGKESVCRVLAVNLIEIHEANFKIE